MIPENVTHEDLCKWEEDRLAFESDPKRIGGGIVPIPPTVWYSGCWLSRELKALGCKAEFRECIITACGQRQAYSEDHWQTAQDVLENYKKGVWEVPGPELALQLVHEKYGKTPDPKRILADLAKAGADPEKLLLLLAEKRMENIIQVRKKSE